jgi:glucose-6-phosphate 1-epimerase
MKLIEDQHIKLSTQGAQLYHWQPKHSSEKVLFCSSGALYEQGKAIRGGIPICWPWFGPKDGAPQHGFIRLTEWQVMQHVFDDESSHLTLEVSSNEKTKALWPYDFKLIYRINASTELDLKLEIHNTDTAPFEFTTALHTYFQISDILSIAIKGLNAISYLDKTKEYNQFIQDGDVHVQGEIDNIYLGAPDITLVDPLMRRTVAISAKGVNCTVVWNPGQEKASTIFDLPEEEYQQFICIENGCIKPAIELKSGECHTIEVGIAVDYL